MSKGKKRHVEMQEHNATTTKFTTEASISTSSNTTFTSQSPTLTTSEDKSFWDENRLTIIIVLCVAIVLLIVFIILMALFIKWKERRKTEGTYNPSRAEKQENQKNKLVFSIPLPTPERLI